jgi:hypothetical protein
MCYLIMAAGFSAMCFVQVMDVQVETSCSLSLSGFSSVSSVCCASLCDIGIGLSVAAAQQGKRLKIMATSSKGSAMRNRFEHVELG